MDNLFNPSGSLNVSFLVQMVLPLILLIISVIGTIITIVWAIAKHKLKYDQACKDLLDLSDKYITTTQDVIRIDTKLSTIVDMLSESIGYQKNVFVANSPVTLTKSGIDLLKSIGFSEIFKQRKQFFINKLKLYSPKDEAALDQACLNLMYSTTDKEIIDQLTVSAYQSGLPLPVLQKICAIYVRNQLKSELV